tara:strand:- start:5099 stop:5473 length:375 start_codon:yes stop_codon:yes gene_type:complete
MDQEPYDHDMEDVAASRTLAISPAIIGWAIAAVALAIFSVTSNNSAMVLGASTFAKIIAAAAGSVLGLAGALLGDALRRFAQPDGVFTQGGMLSLIWIRVFWSIGPQVIGLVGGVFLGAALVLK